jgi:hypothetical protein
VRGHATAMLLLLLHALFLFHAWASLPQAKEKKKNCTFNSPFSPLIILIFTNIAFKTLDAIKNPL